MPLYTAAFRALQTFAFPRRTQILISDICSRLDVDGLRGDIVINRAAKALVAFEGRTEVTTNDVERVISGCLNHR